VNCCRLARDNLWEMGNGNWDEVQTKPFRGSPLGGPHYFSLGRNKHLIYGLVSRKNLLFRFMALCSLLLPTFIYLSFIPSFLPSFLLFFCYIFFCTFCNPLSGRWAVWTSTHLGTEILEPL